MSQHWSNYWKSNATGSFGQQTPDWYRETLEPFWLNIFYRQKKQSRILDIASGNGAVIKLAAQVSDLQHKNFELIAADKAKAIRPVEPSTTPSLTTSIKYMADLPIEKIDFSGHPFDLICSQFGIEYANLSQAIPQLKTSLKPSGKIVVIAHQKHSFIYQQSRKEIKEYQLLLQHYPVFKRAEILLKAMGKLENSADVQKLQNNSSAIKARESFNRLIAKILDKHTDSIVVAEFLKNLNPLFKQLMLTPLTQKLHFLHQLKSDMVFSRQRLLDMISAAMDKTDLQHFLQLAENNQLEAASARSINDENGNLLGWSIELKPQH